MPAAPNDRQHASAASSGRPSSPSPEAVPTAALKHGGLSLNLNLGPASAAGKFSRCLSTASSLSHGSATTRDSRDSLGSEASSSTAFSRQSSGSYSTTSLSLPSLPSLQSYPSTPTLPNQHLAKRRGYMRPQGTDFAASARSRESVLSLGSITHLQYYFARTGLLDLKGQLERRRRGVGKARTLDLSHLDPSSYLTQQPKAPRAVSMLAVPPANYMGASGDSSDDNDDVSFQPGSSSGAGIDSNDGLLVESPIEEGQQPDDEDWYADDAGMLPPTVSTYMYREKPLPRPPTQAELRAELKTSLDNAAKALAEVRAGMAARARAKAEKSEQQQQQLSSPVGSPARSPAPAPALTEAETPFSRTSQHAPSDSVTSVRSVATTAWYEIQGMHILDMMTLAIRAAKVYYTSHEHPDLLDAIKPEREVRSELLGVMDVLRRMATRSFAGGARRDELRAMEAWIASLYAMLDAEDAIAAAERAERAGWTWLHDADWPAVSDINSDINSINDVSRVNRARAYAREHAFMESMLVGAAPASTTTGAIPAWTPLDRDGVDDNTADKPAVATPFLQHMQSGVCLVQLHNCAVRRSRRRFGAIPSFHADTQKPYRAADNLRYWVKAAELRFEVLLKIDALGVVCNSSPAALAAFEDAIYQWCRKVRQEITASVDADLNQNPN